MSYKVKSFVPVSVKSFVLVSLIILLLGLAAFGQAAVENNSPKKNQSIAPGTKSAQNGQTALAETSEKKSSVQQQADTLSSEQIKELIRAVAEKDVENDKKQKDYTYIQRAEEHRLNGKGEVKSTDVKTYEVMEIYGEGVERLIAKNDQPLSAKDAAKEEEKIQKVIDKRKNESDKDREKRLKKEEKDREETREFVKEIADAYNFHLVGVEDLQGRDTYVIDAEPRPGFEPHMKGAQFLPKFRFRVWIDRAESQWVKLDAECIDTVSIGLFLARIHKGSRILVETTRVNDEVWLPQHIALHVDVRLALLKGFNVEQDITYKDYKKFHAATRIVGMEEVK